ncbi:MULTISPECIES: hypothetical protein [Streptomyces]|uniref:Uncharacterized protein n=1 Tax=Streptomyces morookaense TaxID=1970 RepID=A0A7Y7EB97_STRMO|nr:MULTISPECIES: hypothetical protein [Streptomyces]MCC2275339.1 hypothetical protein [Streptomyces sp. ET3-23]NVK82396.1 hypothetical protein [Streptomyces morookaense]GHF42465.1 hypothetical protein GCM10010359_51220 [Streptomyces morookaense]
MPDDVGGRPFPDGEEPDSHCRGGADDPFASVVFDEEFVRAAAVHEPSAAERMLAADRARSGGGPAEDDPYEEAAGDGFRPGRAMELPGFAHELDPDDAYGPYGRYGSTRGPYRGHARWRRPVAWVLAVIMGIGVVALAFAAVYRGAASAGDQEPVPPTATTGAGAPAGPVPSVSADSEPPAAPAAPRRG